MIIGLVLLIVTFFIVYYLVWFVTKYKPMSDNKKNGLFFVLFLLIHYWLIKAYNSNHPKVQELKRKLGLE
jgi:hypothetical protein